MAVDSLENDAMPQRYRLCTDEAKEMIIISKTSIYQSIYLVSTVSKISYSGV